MSSLTPNYGLEKPAPSDPFGDFLQSYNRNMDNIDSNMGGGGSAGHTIENPSGTDMPARGKLQFTGGVTVTDDSANDRTVVNVTGGGGSGDSVSWNQIYTKGEKIAEITINGTTQNVYAPSGGGGNMKMYSMVGQMRSRIKEQISYVIS